MQLRVPDPPWPNEFGPTKTIATAIAYCRCEFIRTLRSIQRRGRM